MIYDQPGLEIPLSQGDILDECPLLFWEISTSHMDFRAESSTTRVRVVVLTQACDLAQAKATRVLLAVVHNARHLVDRGILTAKLIRDQIRTHRVYGWYFLPAGSTIEESIVDLRDLHTIPRVMLEHLIQQGRRVCRITTPFREHLAQHLSTTYARIGLPEAIRDPAGLIIIPERPKLQSYSPCLPAACQVANCPIEHLP